MNHSRQSCFPILSGRIVSQKAANVLTSLVEQLAHSAQATGPFFRSLIAAREPLASVIHVSQQGCATAQRHPGDALKRTQARETHPAQRKALTCVYRTRGKDVNIGNGSTQL
jgi:hypothetical protein